MAKVHKSPLLKDGEYTVETVKELAFFDLTGDKAKTKGTSNKSYHAELHKPKKGNRSQVYTMWGPTGGNQRNEYRYYDNLSEAEADLNKILKSKKKKGYEEIDIAQRSHGSDEAKKITKTVTLTNVSHLGKAKASSLHTETQRLISELMGATNKFVIQTLRCPLGQLTNNQIDRGRDALNNARKVLATNNKTKDQEITDLTNEFYRLIPHNLGSGARGQMTELLLNENQRILEKEADLDTLLDAKSIGAALTSSNVDDKYNSLSMDLEYINHSSPTYKWVNKMVLDTRANNHRHLGKIKVMNIWSASRRGEFNIFKKRAEEIAPQCGKALFPHGMRTLVSSREDIPNSMKTLYKNANIMPLFHGTRTENVVGISKNGLLIRPSNAVITGAMYGNSLYMAKNSTKSINYTSIKSSYWAKGGDSKAFLFLVDCALGNQVIARGPSNYTKKSISPKHSVWAKSNKSGVINDEFMLYNTNQHNIRYIIEFGC